MTRFGISFMFHGSIVALVTPFKNGVLDEKAFQSFVEFQIANGTHGLVPSGTTGESATLSHAENRRVIDLCVEAAAGRVPVIAGTGSNATSEAIELTKHAQLARADGALIVAPYYNRPSQEGMYQHYKAIHDATSIPIVLYNVPGRTVSDLSVETVARLSQLPRIVAIKDASGKLERVGQHRISCRPDFVQLSGDDPTAIAFNAQGGSGVISVTANIAPRLVAEVQNLWAAGDAKGALALNDRLVALHEAMFLEPSPGPAKYAAHVLGMMSNEVRLPILPVSEGVQARIRNAMVTAGVLN